MHKVCLHACSINLAVYPASMYETVMHVKGLKCFCSVVRCVCDVRMSLLIILMWLACMTDNCDLTQDIFCTSCIPIYSPFLPSPSSLSSSTLSFPSFVTMYVCNGVRLLKGTRSKSRLRSDCRRRMSRSQHRYKTT